MLKYGQIIPRINEYFSLPLQNLLGGVQSAVHEVLGQDVGGAHLVLVTRGLQETLSISDEQTIQDYVRYYHIKVSTILVPDAPSSASYPRDLVRNKICFRFFSKNLIKSLLTVNNFLKIRQFLRAKLGQLRSISGIGLFSKKTCNFFCT